MKTKGKQIALVVVILIALAALVKSMSQQVSYERILVDTQANKIFVKKVSSNAVVQFPTNSPFSKGNNAYPVLKCLNCEAVFGVKEKTASAEVPSSPATQDMGTLPTWPKCPACGAVANAMVPELPEGQKSMDVAGPVQLIEDE